MRRADLAVRAILRVVVDPLASLHAALDPATLDDSTQQAPPETQPAQPRETRDNTDSEKLTFSSSSLAGCSDASARLFLPLCDSTCKSSRMQ